MPYLKGKQRRYSFNNLWTYAVMAWAIVITLVVCFLSSAPAACAAHHPAIGNIEYIIPVVSDGGPRPVPYAWWDTSVWLSGWYDMYAAQMALGILEEHIAHMEREANAAAEIDRQMRINEWRADGKNWQLFGVIGFLIAICLGLAYSAQKELFRRKR